MKLKRYWKVICMEKEILKLKERIAKLEGQQEPPITGVEVWKPKHSLSVNTYRVDARTDETEVGFQTYCDNEEQAEQLAKSLRNLALLDAWAVENNLKKEWVNDKDNYFVVFDANNNRYVVDSYCNWRDLRTIYLSRDGAYETAEALNSGYLVLED